MTPDDVKAAIGAVFAHRLVTRGRGNSAAEAVLDEIVESIEVPL